MGPLLLVTLAVVALGLAVWAITLERRLRRLGRTLGEAQAQVTRLERLGALGEMASSFAHSFNDVLTPIIGRTQLLAQRITDPQLREWLVTIERAAPGGAQTVRRSQEVMRVPREGPRGPLDLCAGGGRGVGAPGCAP